MYAFGAALATQTDQFKKVRRPYTPRAGSGAAKPHRKTPSLGVGCRSPDHHHRYTCRYTITGLEKAANPTGTSTRTHESDSAVHLFTSDGAEAVVVLLILGAGGGGQSYRNRSTSSSIKRKELDFCMCFPSSLSPARISVGRTPLHFVGEKHT